MSFEFNTSPLYTARFCPALSVGHFLMLFEYSIWIWGLPALVKPE
jgi:hypothetical protein